MCFIVVVHPVSAHIIHRFVVCAFVSIWMKNPHWVASEGLQNVTGAFWKALLVFWVKLSADSIIHEKHHAGVVVPRNRS